MEQPIVTDYVRTIDTLFERFEQQQTSAKRGHPCTSAEKALIIATVMTAACI